MEKSKYKIGQVVQVRFTWCDWCVEYSAISFGEWIYTLKNFFGNTIRVLESVISKKVKYYDRFAV